MYDWSYAGYHHGEDPLPRQLKVLADVKRDYKAKGDGV